MTRGLLACASLFPPSVDSFKPGELDEIQNVPDEIDLTSFMPADTITQEKLFFLH